jgi:hypothetical protein
MKRTGESWYGYEYVGMCICMYVCMYVCMYHYLYGF